jgi:hypothetical protein
MKSPQEMYDEYVANQKVTMTPGEHTPGAVFHYYSLTAFYAGMAAGLTVTAHNRDVLQAINVNLQLLIDEARKEIGG